MHSLTLPSLVVLALPALAGAQSPLGILNRTATSFTSRGSTTIPNTNPSVAFDRLDKETYAGWGVDPASPGMRQIRGINAVIQDQVGTTPETYGFVVYTEDPAGPNYPLVAAPLGTIGPIPTPASTATGAVAWAVTANFATPVLAPAAGDVFLGISLPQPATGTWPTDGMSLHALYYVNQTGNGGYDEPGSAMPTTQPENGNGGWYVPNPATGPTYTLTPRQWKIEPLVAGAAGVAGTITNLVGNPLSATAPGTSSQGSGLYPDARNPPLNAGRADDVAGRWFMTGAPNNTPVFFLLSFTAFGPELPLATFVPGSTGVACLDIATMMSIGISLSSGGEAYLTIPIPAAVRGSLAGLNVLHQAVGFDPVTGIANGNGCTRQIL